MDEKAGLHFNVSADPLNFFDVNNRLIGDRERSSAGPPSLRRCGADDDIAP